MNTLSPNTQAILLLTAPLLAGGSKTSEDLLTPGEYKRLALHLREIKHQPEDLLAPDAAELLQACVSVIDEDRLRRLLSRGFLLSQAVERWQTRSIWVVSRADAQYPRRLKSRLREDAPAVLYGCGDISLLEKGGLAVVGSRQVDDALIEYTLGIGRLTAKAGKLLISGGAKGIDQAAMRGALEQGGKVCGVLADSLEKTAMNRDHRNLLLDGCLVLASPYDPNAGFNVGNAMQRNKLVYAVADAALVVNAETNKGGTWAGAVEQINKLRLVPVYVRTHGAASEGLTALLQQGALPWPEPKQPDELQDILSGQTLALPNVGGQLTLALTIEEPKPSHALRQNEMSMPDGTINPHRPLADSLYAHASEILRQLLLKPMKVNDIAAALQITPPQAKAWLQRMVDEGLLEKNKQSAVYELKQQSLFE